ncbi:PepSY domain-containing protein [Psychrobacter aestuarii]|uniref:PepSY domain-containing protein n=1 Tax=Psychrobacter aestuarii TaxID=556327 RepID=A0ABN0VM38_9GAMM|nr:PepSY domain-containing protein [Psychrobacter aestuarii]
MQKLSTLNKAIITVLSVTAISTTAIAVGQSNTQLPVSETVAAVQSKISLEQAMSIAQKTVKGDVIGAEFDQYDRSAGGNYEVTIVANNSEYDVKVDAKNGQVSTSKQEKMDNEDIAEYNAMKKSNLSLNQAIKKANQRINGTIVEAGFDVDAGKSVYEIEIVKGNQVYDVVVDSMTGQIVRSQAEMVDDDD